MREQVPQGLGKGISMSWYYCLAHQAVEPELGCANAERMGPYATEGEAAQALQTAHERNEEYDSGEED